MTIEELREARHAAERAYNCRKTERDAFVRERLAAARDAIEAEAQVIYGEDVAALSLAAANESDAESIAIESAALAGVDAKFPVGSKLVEWATPRDHWTHRVTGSIKPTGRTGIYEAVTRATHFPGNLAPYSYPAVGSFIIRLHKKDGTLGLQIVKGYDMVRFYLESVTPEVKP